MSTATAPATTITARFARHWLLVALLVAIAASSVTVAIIGLTSGFGGSKSAPAIRAVPAPVGDLYQGGYAERRPPATQHVSPQPLRTAESSPQVPGHRP